MCARNACAPKMQFHASASSPRRCEINGGLRLVTQKKFSKRFVRPRAGPRALHEKVSCSRGTHICGSISIERSGIACSQLVSTPNGIFTFSPAVAVWSAAGAARVP
mmetsp:Transcript_6175/g.11483  ORF Transcript_6175/g.11483 Transcript_6175/m.11483 type:complete len:106 (+) Transcript_6175:235-552(+)